MARSKEGATSSKSQPKKAAAPKGQKAGTASTASTRKAQAAPRKRTA